MKRSADAVRAAYADTDPDVKEALDADPDAVIDIGVSFDGTWQKRGFTSLYGVGVCIDVMTGLVVDYELLSKYCHACKLMEAKHLPAQELADWKERHADECCVTHTLSSKAMEQEAAKRMWARSVAENRMRYTAMLSDGDSAAYKTVCDLAPYGDQAVSKLECVNHAHKRMGTALRKLSKENRLGGKGTGRLTERKCDNLQNFYRGAILDNLTSVEAMRSAVWATFFHSISTDESPQHQRCPHGVSSWCFFQRALAAGVEPPSHRDHPGTTQLSREVAEEMIPVYRRMSDEALLRRMIHGGTQNANECLNSQIWVRCPKTSFMGKRRVEGAVARAVGVFNEGATDLARVMNRMWMDVSTTSVQLMKRADSRRIAAAEAASTDAQKQRRKNSDICKRLVLRDEQEAEGPTYGPGMG